MKSVLKKLLAKLYQTSSKPSRKYISYKLVEILFSHDARWTTTGKYVMCIFAVLSNSEVKLLKV
jgi:hypothetical protein